MSTLFVFIKCQQRNKMVQTGACCLFCFFVQYPTRLSHKQAYMEVIIQNNVRGNAMKCFSGTDRHDIC